MSEHTMEAACPVGPAMPTSEAPPYADSVWIGAVEDAEFVTGRQYLTGLDGYRSARLLVRSGNMPRGFVELDVREGRIDLPQAASKISALPSAAPEPGGATPPISIVLCTFDRPALLACALATLLDLDYPDFEIVVVDNNPGSGLTAPVVRALDDGARRGDRRIRLVEEPARGLARARNTGLLSARNDTVAFTDDDVVVDRYWLRGIAAGFAAGSVAGPAVACVSGIVPSGDLFCGAELLRPPGGLGRQRPA